jgi:hypothetical protein
MWTHSQQADSHDQHSDHGRQPASHPVAEWTKEVGAQQVGDAGRQKSRSSLPGGSSHVFSHPDWQRRLQHGDAHVGEHNRPGRDQDIRILDEVHVGCRVITGRSDMWFEHNQLKNCNSNTTASSIPLFVDSPIKFSASISTENRLKLFFIQRKYYSTRLIKTKKTENSQPLILNKISVNFNLILDFFFVGMLLTTIK